MSIDLDELVETLLWEGYALYPYTPGAIKNATPTPFGIVYPPAYAERTPSTFDHLRIQCLVEGDGELSAEIRFLQSAGSNHEARERRVDLRAPGRFELAFPPLAGRVRLRVEPAADDRRLVSCCVHNTTPAAEALDRVAALQRSFLSTHVVLRTSRGRFLSPLEHAGDNLNSYPVLASERDDVVLGAAIVLPDHPRVAPESRGSLFDGTEIEEALLLHVRALSDDEREQIVQSDPAIRAMIERAAAATPEDLARLHGRVTLRDPREGEPEASVGGVTYRRGDHVRLLPDPDRDPYDRMLHGRGATVERIFTDYDDRVHLAVSIDDDPARELMRDTGRFHFFKPEEVELL
ncbi:MAG TPA: hypothetical protein VI111_06525 [Thermoleophilaceae bacterium]